MTWWSEEKWKTVRMPSQTLKRASGKLRSLVEPAIDCASLLLEKVSSQNDFGSFKAFRRARGVGCSRNPCDVHLRQVMHRL